jgi:hypothetical protein
MGRPASGAPRARNSPGRNSPGRNSPGRNSPGRNSPGQNSPGQNSPGLDLTGRAAEQSTITGPEPVRAGPKESWPQQPATERRRPERWRPERWGPEELDSGQSAGVRGGWVADLSALTAVAAGPVSSSRARQLRWVTGELRLWAGTLPPSQVPATVADLFTPARMAAFIRAADSGKLRRRPTDRTTASAASGRVRIDCLARLAGAAGVPRLSVPRPALPPPTPRAAVRAARLAAATDQLAILTSASRPRPGPSRSRRTGSEVPRSELPSSGVPGSSATGAGRTPLRRSPARTGAVPLSATRVRGAAVAALVRDIGMRTGELADLQLADVNLARATVTYRQAQPSRRIPDPPITAALTVPAAAALRAWLQVRAELVTQAPRVTALFVSVAGNHDGAGVRRPPGLPLRPRGLLRAHHRRVQRWNAELADTVGYTPIPATLRALRPPPAPRSGSGRSSPRAPVGGRTGGGSAPASTRARSPVTPHPGIADPTGPGPGTAGRARHGVRPGTFAGAQSAACGSLIQPPGPRCRRSP